jgi:hypothetical protein
VDDSSLEGLLVVVDENLLRGEECCHLFLIPIARTVSHSHTTL